MIDVVLPLQQPFFLLHSLVFSFAAHDQHEKIEFKEVLLSTRSHAVFMGNCAPCSVFCRSFSLGNVIDGGGGVVQTRFAASLVQ